MQFFRDIFVEMKLDIMTIIKLQITCKKYELLDDITPSAYEYKKIGSMDNSVLSVDYLISLSKKKSI